MKGFLRKAYTLPALAVTTIQFDGVTPNYFRIDNGGNARIYAGVVNMPTSKLYDFKVEPAQTRMYCTDKGYPMLYLYNSSGSPADVIVTSFIEEFSPEVLAFADFNTQTNEEQTVNVEIGGFTEPLPAGHNHIGDVSIEGLPQSLTNLLESISGKITGKDYTSLLQAIETAVNNIEISGGSSGGGSSKDYTEILEAIETAVKNIDVSGSGGTSEPETHLYSHDGNISYGEYWSMDKDIRELVYATNDGEADINICLFDNGECITMKLKAGETINHIKGKFTTIGVDTSVHSVTIPYRLVYKYV